MPNAPDRSTLIRANMHKPSKSLSSAADALNDRFQELLAEVADLDPSEQARLLNGLIGQMNGQIGRLL